MAYTAPESNIEPIEQKDDQQVKLTEEPHITHNRVTSNTLIYLFSQLLTWATGIVTLAIPPRVLGEVAMGQIALAHTYVGQIALILTLSVEQYLATEIGRDRSQSEHLLGATLGLRLVCIPIMVVVTSLALILFHVSHIVWLLGIQVMLGASIGYMLGPMRWILAGWEDAKRVARNDLMLIGLQLLAFPFLRYGVVVFSLVSLIASQPANIATTLAVRKHLRLRPIFDLSAWARILQGSFGFLVNDMIAPLFAIFTVYILKRYTDEATIGVYAQSQRLLGTFMFVPNALGMAILPSLARLADVSRTEFHRMQQRVISAMVVMGLPIVLMAFMLAGPFCHLIYGTDQFRTLPQAVQVSGLCVIPLYITTMLYRFLVAERKNAIWCGFLAITLFIQSTLCALLVPVTLQAPWHNGSLGAIFATAIAEAVTVICALLLLRSNPFSMETVQRLLRAMVAVVAMGLVMWLTRGLFFLFTAIIGMGVFGLIAWKLEALGAEDQKNLATYATIKLARTPVLRRFVQKNKP